MRARVPVRPGAVNRSTPDRASRFDRPSGSGYQSATLSSHRRAGHATVSAGTAPPASAVGLLRRSHAVLGPLLQLVPFCAGALVLLSTSRLALTLGHFARVSRVEGFWQLFPIGLRLDIMTLCPAMFFPALVVLLCPPRVARFGTVLVAAYLASIDAVMVFIEAATVPFLAQYDSRPNRI